MSELSKFLKQRGSVVTKEGNHKDILVPVIGNRDLQDSFLTLLYSFMDKEQFRRDIRSWAYEKSPDLEYFEQILAYIELSKNFDHTFEQRIRTKANRINIYSRTFEWYISEVLKRKFNAQASGFSIRLKDADAGDEFDCIAVLDSGLAYIECKTGKAEIQDEVRKFVQRDTEIAATQSLFIYDRSYVFTKGKDDIPDLTESTARSIGIDRISAVSGNGVRFYQVFSGNRYFLASSSFRNLEKRIVQMLRFTTMERDGGDSHRKAYEVSQVRLKPD